MAALEDFLGVWEVRRMLYRSREGWVGSQGRSRWMERPLREWEEAMVVAMEDMEGMAAINQAMEASRSTTQACPAIPVAASVGEEGGGAATKTTADTSDAITRAAGAPSIPTATSQAPSNHVAAAAAAAAVVTIPTQACLPAVLATPTALRFLRNCEMRRRESERRTWLLMRRTARSATARFIKRRMGRLRFR